MPRSTEKLYAAERIIGWRLADGNRYSMGELVHANYGHRPDGGPLCAKQTVGIYIGRLRRWARARSIEIKVMNGWGWYIDPGDLQRFRDALAAEIQEHV